MKAKLIAVVVCLAGCASAPDVTIEPPQPFNSTMTFNVETEVVGQTDGIDSGLTLYVAETLIDRGWTEAADDAALTLQVDVDFERVLEIERASGWRGYSAVTDVRAGADITLAIAIVDTAGVTVWAGSDDLNVPLGTDRDAAREMVLDKLDAILAAIPVKDRLLNAA
ncbi:MAG: hypothetical protein AAFX44_04305 [Pseudomonadota bacterium]